MVVVVIKDSNRCDICGELENIPFRCNRCRGTFCGEHRLPEKHNCSTVASENQKSWRANDYDSSMDGNNSLYRKSTNLKKYYVWRWPNKYPVYIIIGIIAYFIAGLIITIIQKASGFLDNNFVFPLFSSFGYANDYQPYIIFSAILALGGILLIIYSILRLLLKSINKGIKRVFRNRNYYGNRNKGLATLGFVAAIISVFLPWVDLKIFGESLGGISLYNILIDFDSLENSFVRNGIIHNSNELLTIYGSIALLIIAVVSSLIIIILWGSQANKIWVPGAFAIGSFILWFMFIQNTGIYNIFQSGFDIGIGSWVLLVAAGLWIWSNMDL